MNKVSIVIPTYNSAAWLPHAVKSAQEQTYKDIEIVIVDDCSTDTTDQYIKWLLNQGDKRIAYYRNDKNLGRSATRNRGNQMAIGDVLCVLDADDLMMQTRVEWTLKKMKSCGVCYGGAVVMDALGNALNEIPGKPVNFEEAVKTKQNGIVHSSLAYTKELALKYPYADGKISDLGLDDWHQQIRMLADGVKFDYIPDTICAYRVHGQAITKTRDPKAVEAVKDEVLEGLKCKI